MSGIRREHVRVLNVDDETGHMEPLSAAGAEVVAEVAPEVAAEVVTATGGRSRRVADGVSVPRVAHIGSAQTGSAQTGSAQIGSAQIGGARIGLARIGITGNGDARSRFAHSRIARGGVPHADFLDGMRHDTDGPEHRTSGPEHRAPGPEPRTAGLTSAPTIHSGRGAANAGIPTEAGR
ncbi:hypothetical protein AB0H67_10275 [Streptomyces phaeochromogenes]|uniref:hypothetical protein n=1 Tax=Streptomyces phaeochromogenes TaxID=1923 RepID=UPI003403B98F